MIFYMLGLTYIKYYTHGARPQFWSLVFCQIYTEKSIEPGSTHDQEQFVLELVCMYRECPSPYTRCSLFILTCVLKGYMPSLCYTFTITFD